MFFSQIYESNRQSPFTYFYADAAGSRDRGNTDGNPYRTYSRSISVGPMENERRSLSRANSFTNLNSNIYGYRSKSVDPEIYRRSTIYGSSNDNGFYDYLRGRNRRATTVGPTSRISSNYYDRYTELPIPKVQYPGSITRRPIIDGYYHHFRPYYWYSTIPRTVSYFYPFSDWRYSSRYHSRTPSLYSFYSPNDSYVWRMHGTLTNVKALQSSNRDMGYLRAMRALRLGDVLPQSMNTSYFNKLDRQPYLVRQYA